MRLLDARPLHAPGVDYLQLRLLLAAQVEMLLEPLADALASLFEQRVPPFVVRHREGVIAMHKPEYAFEQRTGVAGFEIQHVRRRPGSHRRCRRACWRARKSSMPASASASSLAPACS